jgi:hypothetical protein
MWLVCFMSSFVFMIHLCVLNLDWIQKFRSEYVLKHKNMRLQSHSLREYTTNPQGQKKLEPCSHWSGLYQKKTVLQKNNICNKRNVGCVDRCALASLTKHHVCLYSLSSVHVVCVRWILGCKEFDNSPCREAWGLGLRSFHCSWVQANLSTSQRRANKTKTKNNFVSQSWMFIVFHWGGEHCCTANFDFNQHDCGNTQVQIAKFNLMGGIPNSVSNPQNSLILHNCKVWAPWVRIQNSLILHNCKVQSLWLRIQNSLILQDLWGGHKPGKKRFLVYTWYWDRHKTGTKLVLPQVPN